MKEAFWKIYQSRFHAMEEVYWVYEARAMLRGKLWEGWQVTPEGIITPSGEVALHPVLVGYLVKDRFGNRKLEQDVAFLRQRVDELLAVRAGTARPRKRR